MISMYRYSFDLRSVFMRKPAEPDIDNNTTKVEDEEMRPGREMKFLS